MTHCEQVNHSSGNVESVDDSIVAHTQTVPVAAGEMMMWEMIETPPHLVDFSFNARTNARRQFEEGGVKGRVVNLKRGVHTTGSRTPRARARTGTHFLFRLFDLRLELVGEGKLIFEHTIEPVTNLLQLRGREFLHFGFDLLDPAHANSVRRARSGVNASSNRPDQDSLAHAPPDNLFNRTRQCFNRTCASRC